MRQYAIKLNNSLDFNVKDVDTNGRVVSLYAAAFDNIDRDGDVIVKGAFKKTIKEQGPQGIDEIWHLLYHNPDMPVSKAFELTEDNYGLLAKVRMPNTDRGNDTLQMYLDGHYKHHSIGYQTIRKQDRQQYKELQELRLFEKSTVLWAANPAATVVDVKSLLKDYSKDQLQKEIDLTIKSFRSGHYTDETFSLLEIKMKQLIQAVSETSDTPAVPVEETPEPSEKGVNAEYARMKIKLLTTL